LNWSFDDGIDYTLPIDSVNGSEDIHVDSVHCNDARNDSGMRNEDFIDVDSENDEENGGEGSSNREEESFDEVDLEVENGEENGGEEVNCRKRKTFVDEKDVENLYMSMGNICEICGQVFNERRTLYFHRRNTHILKFQCGLCHRKFLDREKLDAHKKTHITRLSNNCHLCGKTYMTKQTLKRHYYNKHLKFIEDMTTTIFPIMFINVFDVK